MKIISEVYKKTDENNNTLTIVKSDFGGSGRVFGGFTNIPWRSYGGSDGIDQIGQSFLFSIRDDGSIETFRARKRMDEVYHQNYALVKFANTIHIFTDCNMRYDNVASLAHQSNFTMSNKLKSDEKMAETYLGGFKRFRVAEIEVFIVKYE